MFKDNAVVRKTKTFFFTKIHNLIVLLFLIKQIGKRIIESYKLILDFYGIQLDDEATGVTSRAENYLVRYKDTFLRPFTNHDFRVKRML